MEILEFGFMQRALAAGVLIALACSALGVFLVLRRESLVGVAKDPGELVNLAGDPAHRAVLEEHRRYLSDWCRTTGDSFVVPA